MTIKKGDLTIEVADDCEVEISGDRITVKAKDAMPSLQLPSPQVVHHIHYENQPYVAPYIGTPQYPYITDPLPMITCGISNSLQS